MGAGRCGLLPDDKVPSGRLQPWVAVGPAVLFPGMKPKSTVCAGDTMGGIANPQLPVAAQPNFHFNFTDIHSGPTNLNFRPVYTLFSGMAGVAYHF